MMRVAMVSPISSNTVARIIGRWQRGEPVVLGQQRGMYEVHIAAFGPLRKLLEEDERLHLDDNRD
jgi:hypothetical protein